MTAREAEMSEAPATTGMQAQQEKLAGPGYTTIPTLMPDRAAPGEVMSDIMVSARDGVRLATDVYLPAGAGPFPAVLTRLPYGKTEAYCFMPTIAAYWVRKGYAAVVQDVRGKFGSEGVFEPNKAANEIADGYDTIDWIARQPWSSGRVGMWGESYFGFTSWAGAVGGHPALAAVAPGDIAVNRYEGTYRNGALQLQTVGLWAIQMVAQRYQDLSKLDTWHWPLAEMGTTAGLRSSYFDAVVANPWFSDFWAERSLVAAYERVRIPVLHWGGWYDLYLGPTIADWRRMRAANAGMDHNHLFIGPWDHEGTADSLHRAGLMPIADGTLAHRWDTYAAFFDRYLAGIDNGFGARGSVHYYTMGADHWHDATEWPPPATRTERWYLHSGRWAQDVDGHGALTTQPPGDEAPDEYTYDPHHPVDWTLAVDCWAIAGGMGDRQPVGERHDVLVYASGPLEEALELTGPITGRLHVASSASNTDFTMALCDVFPDGRVNLVQDCIVRATHRRPAEGSLGLGPGEVEPIDFDLWSTSYVVAAGHRLGVEVSSSDFNRYDRNPNTAAPYGREAHPVPAGQTVYHDRDHPSYIDLPVAPARR